MQYYNLMGKKQKKLFPFHRSCKRDMSRVAKLAQEKNQHSQQVQDSEDSESRRCDRNLLEKKRRDKFNGLIDELASCLADRCHTKRSTEKSSILKLTSEYFLEQEKLAAEKAANELIRNVKPPFVTDDEFDFVYLESMDMVVFALDQTGKVVYISDNALSTLGYIPVHILQRDVFEFIDARNQFTFQGMLSVLKDSSDICPSGESNITRFEPFWCQFRRGPFGQGDGFETICCFGAIVRNLLSRENDENFEEVSESLIILARPLNVPVEKTLLKADGRQTKFTSTLNMEAKYDYLDKRVAAVLGFFPSELSGSSLYEFCHVDDLDDLVKYHKVLLLTGRITTSYYRHMTKGQSWVWLRSRYHLSYSDWTSKPQAVTCLTWVVPFREVCAKQAEVLSRDKESFAQILNGTNGIDGKSASSQSSMNLPAVASPCSENEAGEMIQAQLRSKRTSAQESTRSTTSESPVARTPGPEETQSNCALLIPSSTDMDDNQPIDFQESFQFLRSLDLPMDLTGAQQSLHRFLLETYVQVMNSFNKQVEELSAIQKQIKIQGEIRDLVERLEKERSSNDVGSEYTTTKEMLLKFEEMRRVCLGTEAVKPASESAAICSQRLQEIVVQNRPEELESSITSETNQQMTKEIVEQNHSPMQVEESNSTQTRPDIFFNQERWLQTQAQQAQIQQQALLDNRFQELEYAVTSEENQHMTNEVEGPRKSPMQLAEPKSTPTQPNIFFNQEGWLQTQARQAHPEPDISFNQERQWFQTQTQQVQLQRQAFLAQQMINSQYLPQEQLMLFQQPHLLVQQLHQKQLEAEAPQTSQRQQQQQLEHCPSSTAGSVSLLINSPNAVSQQGTSSVHSGMTSELSLTSISQQDSPHSPNDCLYDYQWF